MEKLGVLIPKDPDKTASDQKTCPKCLAVLDPDVNVSKCPNCGVLPFEKQEDSTNPKT
jgi:hypothetical protein